MGERDREVADKIANIMRVEWMQADDEAKHLSDLVLHALADARAEEREAIAKMADREADLIQAVIDEAPGSPMNIELLNDVERCRGRARGIRARGEQEQSDAR